MQNHEKVNQSPKTMKTFTIIWAGQLVSILGSGLTNFALGVWIFDQTGQATPFALTALFSSLPRLLFMPMGGSLADRRNRRLIMILADTGAALITLAFALLILTDQLQIWHIYLGVVLSSTFSAFQEPAYNASITMLVPKKDLARAGGMSQISQALSSLLTPILAGFLFVSIGLKGVIWIDFVTYFFAVGALLFVRIPQPERTIVEMEAKGSAWKDAVFGWNYLRERTGLFLLLSYFALVNFFFNVSGVMLTPLVLSFGGPDALGLVQGALGLGMLLGSVIISAWGGPKRRMLGLVVFIGLTSLGMVIAGSTMSVFVIGLGTFMLMLFVPMASALSQAVFQTKVAPDIQGRVFAVRGMIAQSIMPLAFLISGPLADHVFEPLMAEDGALASTFVGTIFGTGAGHGIGLMFIISGLFLAMASALAYMNPRIRNLEEEIPDAIPDEGWVGGEIEGEGISGEAVPTTTGD
ncbi:MAG: MFS transporter [Anaerolineales bacterium]|jgi:MFS family permease